MEKKGSFDALNPEAEIFKKLIATPPSWWKLFREDNELYVDIRKDNYISVYYYGGSLAKIEYKDNNYTAEINPKYNDNNKLLALEDLTKDKIKEIKTKIRKEYLYRSGEPKNDEELCEADIKGKMILKKKNRHIDSEFAFELEDEDLIKLAKELNKNEEEENAKLLRIDLTEILDGKLSFVELKLIDDNRLRRLDGKPEILLQMEIYAKFISRNKDSIIEYYKKLIKIKKELKLIIDESVQEAILTPDITPKLMIVNTYEKMTEGREERIKDIKKILTENKIEYEIKKLEEL